MSGKAAGASKEALTLSEGITLDHLEEAGAAYDEKGRIPIHVIRPGIGKGRGRHLYEADMLEANANVFTGWKMFVDHRSPEAKKAAGGLPRSLRDSGGIVKEAYWDPDVPADPEKGFAQGAVVGLVRPSRLVRDLIEDDPEMVEASISATATGVKQVTRDGQRVWLVEGIAPKGSVDWVTEAGAGGRVVPLMEAAAEDERELLEAMNDEQFREYIEEERPHLLEARETEGDDDVADITQEQLQESLSENPKLLIEAAQGSEEFQNFVTGLMESKISEAREEVRAEAEADGKRLAQLARLERVAHTQIKEAKLPETWETGLIERYSLTEAGDPSPALDVVDETGDDGEVTKSAREVLKEALEEEISREREKLAEARPTRVRDQGGRSTFEGDAPPEPLKSAKKTGYGRLLQEAGVDPDKAYVVVGADEEDDD